MSNIVIAVLFVICLALLALFIGRVRACKRRMREKAELRRLAKKQDALRKASFIAYQAMLDEAIRNLPPY